MHGSFGLIQYENLDIIALLYISVINQSKRSIQNNQTTATPKFSSFLQHHQLPSIACEACSSSLTLCIRLEYAFPATIHHKSSKSKNPLTQTHV